MMSFSQAAASKRREKDIMKLLMSDFMVTNDPNVEDTFQVEFKGPKESPYSEGIWTINLFLPKEYPFKSPSVGFANKIFHPNIDLKSGAVCLDVINQAWSPMFDLINVLEIFIPQLLLYPNPTSPLNSDAASLYSSDINAYNETVKAYVTKFASPNIDDSKNGNGIDSKDPSNSKASTENEDGKVNEEKYEDISGIDALSDQSELSELSKTSQTELIEEESLL